MTTAAPRVGDTLTTAEQLDALPDGVVVMLPTSKVPAVRFEDVWFVPGFEEGQPSSGLRLPTTVLYVPGEQPGRSTDQALAEAWAEGHRTGWEHCQDGNYGNDHWDDPTPNPYAAAGRAETTTATNDEAVGELLERMSDAVTRLEALRAEHREASECQRLHGKIEGVKLAASYVEEARGLLATARTVDVHPTYTVEYQQKIADELGVEREAVLRALGLAAPLLATARTHPTREQIDRAVGEVLLAYGEVLLNAANHPDPVAVLGRSIAPLRTKITHAVLDLLRDGERRG